MAVYSQPAHDTATNLEFLSHVGHLPRIIAVSVKERGAGRDLRCPLLLCYSKLLAPLI